MDASTELKFNAKSIIGQTTGQKLIWVNWKIGNGSEVGFALPPDSAQRLINQMAGEIARMR